MEVRLRVGAAIAAAAFCCWVPSASAQTAPGAPGALSHFDLARKDCVGTAQNTRSKVWFTVAGGVLSDVYYPTNDNTNNETLQYVVTDGSTFTDLQTRDMTYTVSQPDDRALTCRVTATAKSGRYRIVTDYLTDPDRQTVILHSRFEGPRGDKLYVRFDPTLNGNGGGGTGNGGADSGTVVGGKLVGSDTVTATNAANRDYAQPVYSALDGGFDEISNGYAGTDSDGLKQLDAAHRLTATYTEALKGNLVQTARVDRGRHGDFTIALGFGSTANDALGAARGSLREPLFLTAIEYSLGWRFYNKRLERPDQPKGVSSHDWDALLDEYYLSADYVKGAEDKTFPGATAAAWASPWGQAISAGDPANTYFGSYREVFARDLYEAWTAMFLAGDRETAKDMTRFLFERQQLADGSMPRNSLTNGKQAPDSFNTQLDECAYPLVMALAVGLTSKSYYEDHIKPAANFVATHGPTFGPERWEEQDGFSPSTISAEIAGLLAAAEIADLNHDDDSAAIWRGVADEFQRNLKTWTLNTNRRPEDYFIRLSKTGDPNAAITYNVGNGGPTLDQRDVIDAGFLEFARLGLLKKDDADIVRSLAVVDSTIRKTTDSGDGFLRYNGDGYGDRSSDGRPWAPSNQGTGHVWPVLAGERGQWELDNGDVSAAVKRLKAMQAMGGGVGLIPEQAWDQPDLARSPFGSDPTTASIGFENGEPAGSAAALTWSAGQFVRLMLDVSAGKVLDRPDYTTNRYVKHKQGQTTLTVTAPEDRTAVTGGTTVVGTTKPGNTVVVGASNQDDHTAKTYRVKATNGSFSIDITLTGGTTVLNIVAIAPNGDTARAVRTVVFDFAPGTLLFSADDPDGDDNGPGNYAYPTSSNFKAGAYDLERFEVYDAGERIIFRVRTRNLAPTFGSPLGAQLVNLYIRIPGGSPVSNAAAFPQRNYTVFAGWTKRIEVQGFGQQYMDASTPPTTLGQVDIKGNDISRYITFSVTKASLGTPAAGWQYTVVLTGQDGFSPDQARGFKPTPEEFQFGVCATASSDPHCTFDPGLVPKAMDVFGGRAQLDYTLGPVSIQPVP